MQFRIQRIKRKQPTKQNRDIMGDKSPKSVNKKNAQKQSKDNTSKQKKQASAVKAAPAPAKKK